MQIARIHAESGDFSLAIIHSNADSVAGYSRLRHFEYPITNAVAIANANLVVRKPLNGEILSKLAADEVFASEKAFPVVIRVHLINKDGTLLSAVTGEIALGVAIDVELAHHSPAFHWRFPDRGTDSLAVPCHVTWKANIY